MPLVTSAVDLKVPADGVVLAYEHLGPVSLLLPLTVAGSSIWCLLHPFAVHVKVFLTVHMPSALVCTGGECEGEAMVAQ